MNNKVFKDISKTINALDIVLIPEVRKQTLQPLIDYINKNIKDDAFTRLNFICTHNSRRSHLSQVWAQTMAAFYNINKVYSYSGGTEATALFPKVEETLIKQGFKIEALSKEKNPIYSIKYNSNEPAIIAFSKVFSANFNPASKFAAIMTCSSADKGCPIVMGCDIRIPITYEDPKIADGTPQQNETYFKRSLEIATEMKYVFSKVR